MHWVDIAVHQPDTAGHASEMERARLGNHNEALEERSVSHKRALLTRLDAETSSFTAQANEEGSCERSRSFAAQQELGHRHLTLPQYYGNNLR